MVVAAEFMAHTSQPSRVEDQRLLKRDDWQTDARHSDFDCLA